MSDNLLSTVGAFIQRCRHRHPPLIQDQPDTRPLAPSPISPHGPLCECGPQCPCPLYVCDCRGGIPNGYSETYYPGCGCRENGYEIRSHSPYRPPR
jgi:hypothetical protein